MSQQLHILHVCFDTVVNLALDVIEQIFSGFEWKTVSEAP